MNGSSHPPELRVLPEAPPPKSSATPSPQSGKNLALARVHRDQEIRITSIQLGPRKRDQLHEQGIMEACSAEVLHNDHKGRVILRLDNELFILGRLETARVFVVVT